MKITLLALVAVLGLAACQKSGPASVQSMQPKQVAGLLSNKFGILVDVREDSEVAHTGKAKSALHIPMSEFKSQSPKWAAFKANLPKDKTVVFYCAAGGRAGKIAQALADEGYKTANMGGFGAWEAAGLPVEKP